ncbi:MAG: sugar-binding domain-containing protein [Ginsengibacter sp.]
MRKTSIIFWFAFLLFQSMCIAQNKSADIEDKKQQLREWKLQSTTQVGVNESVVSSIKCNTTNWVRAQIPTSVLGALVKAGIYPDPHFDLNDLRIPDASDELSQRLDLNKYTHLKGIANPFKDPYWFRTTFNIPKENKDKRVWLNFDGINYRADVWLNGKQIADASEMAGMFLRFKYDVTQYINQTGTNVLAVKIHQVDHVGTPDPGFTFTPFGPRRGQGTDIFKDVTLKFMAGWDCAPVVRDRNMGLYQDVYLTYTGDVKIADPYIITDLGLPDTTLANVSVSAVLTNAAKGDKKVILRGTIDLLKEVDFYSYKKTMPGNLKTIVFEKEVELAAGQTLNVSFSPDDFAQLKIVNPYLWWPNGYGRQYLHNLKLTVETDGAISDVKNVTFGIRKITTTLKELNGEYGRIFWINGKKIFCRGGWIQPDMMLDMNKKRVYDEARLLAESNTNMIACEDMPSPPEQVMAAYDKYGLLVWETFYQCWTSYPGTESFANPLNTELSLKNSFDIVKRYRNNPSLVLWAGACETIMRGELYKPLRKFIKEMDTTRPFIATSSYDWNIDSLTPYMKPDMPTGMTDDGPPDYTWYPHAYYYDKVLEVKKQMFRDELGVPAVSTAGSMRKYIFDLGKGPINNIYPLDKKWAYHDAWDGDGYAFRAYDSAIRNQFGQPATAEEYIRNAQYINAGSYRAMYEAYNHRMWTITSGVMLWKLNATWPQVVWQIYDWFLCQNAGYFYAKKAMEPLHIQLNENNYMVSVINTMHHQHKNLTAVVKVFNDDLKVMWQKEGTFHVEENCYKELFQIPKMEGLSKVYFVKLILKDEAGSIVSDNFYWLSSLEKTDFTDILKLPKVKPDVQQTNSYSDSEVVVKVTVKNPSDKLAFFKRLMITKGNGGDEVVPTFWSDNFFTLLPGEEKIITARFAKIDLGDQKPVVVFDRDY